MDADCRNSCHAIINWKVGVVIVRFNEGNITCENIASIVLQICFSAGIDIRHFKNSKHVLD
jgi:hypothetical protein